MKRSSYDIAQDINFTVYTTFGYWKTYSKRPAVRFMYRLYSAFVITMTTAYTFLQIADLKDAVGDIGDLSTNMTATITSIFSMAKVYSLKLNMNRVEKLRQDFRRFLNAPGVGLSEEDQDIFEKDAKNFLWACKIFYSLVWLTILAWWIFPFANGFLPVRLWVPFDSNTQSTAYIGVYLYECLLLFYFAGIVSTSDLIQTSFVFLVSAHFDVLVKNLRSLGAEVESEEANRVNKQEMRCRVGKRIALLARHHQEILRAAEEVDCLFGTTNLIHLIGVGVLISVSEFDIIQKSSVMNSQYVVQCGNLASAFFDLFMYSYYGSMLQDKSFGISFAVYDSPWYVLDPSSRKTLLFMMTRSQKFARITAGKMLAINLSTYLSIVKNSYNLLAVLRQTK